MRDVFVIFLNLYLDVFNVEKYLKMGNCIIAAMSLNMILGISRGGI